MAGSEQSGINLHRLSPELQAQLKPLYDRQNSNGAYLEVDKIHLGDALDLLPRLKPNSIDLSVWSPPPILSAKNTRRICNSMNGRSYCRA
jgi:hypothetical protein